METVVLVKQFYYGDKFICLMPDKKKKFVSIGKNNREQNILIL